MNETRRVLVVAASAKGLGGGHLARSGVLVEGLRAAGIDARLLFDPEGGRSVAEVLATAGATDSSVLYQGDPSTETWTFIVLDLFRTSKAAFRRWAATAPLVGIDEGGPARAAFDYLVDLLPGLEVKNAPNVLDPGLLPLPVRRRSAFVDQKHAGPYRVLVSFGAEDPAGLSLPTVRSLAALSGFSVDALLGPLAVESHPTGEEVMIEAGARVLRALPNLKERLADYDLVVTSYGLTAFEAAHARVPVLLVSPSPYHERLARARGFVSAGTGRAAAARVGSFLPAGHENATEGGRPGRGLRQLAERTAAAAPRGNDREPASAAEMFASFEFPGGARCPLCGTRGALASGRRGEPLARFTDRSYRRCHVCGMIHMVRPCPPPITYAHDYFFDDYKKQYGRTYLEDFPQLERAGAARVRRIAELLDRAAGREPRTPATGEAPGEGWKPRILDVGCAYGPFLAAARSAGFDCFGLDPAEDAVRFVREELGIPAVVGAFPRFDPSAAFGGTPFDVVSLWYVIEHFVDLGAALEAASGALKKGGVLAFSTPSGSGISARAGFADFLRKSPADHWTIWEPGRTGRFLERFGFKLEKIIVTGHHPERFPGLAEMRNEGLPRRLAAATSRIFDLGDTFEAYAVKK